MKNRILSRAAAGAAVALCLLAAGAASSPFAADATKGEKAALVDVNTATPQELEKLPGIGPALAKRIVEYREKNGPYGSVDDLLKVQGIGEKSLQRFRDLLTASKPPKK